MNNYHFFLTSLSSLTSSPVSINTPYLTDSSTPLSFYSFSFISLTTSFNENSAVPLSLAFYYLGCGFHPIKNMTSNEAIIFLILYY
jgi:hypothetical protein